MKIIALVPALLLLGACDKGMKASDTNAEEAAADGQVVGNASAAPAPSATPTPESGQ